MAGAREHLAELAAADRTDRERVVAHRLDDVERVAAIAAAVLVGRHDASSLAEGSNATSAHRRALRPRSFDACRSDLRTSLPADVRMARRSYGRSPDDHGAPSARSATRGAIQGGRRCEAPGRRGADGGPELDLLVGPLEAATIDDDRLGPSAIAPRGDRARRSVRSCPRGEKTDDGRPSVRSADPSKGPYTHVFPPIPASRRRKEAVMPVRKAVIPAAGLGTRFLPATKAQPKEMLPVVDKPSIQYVVEEAVARGAHRHPDRHRARQAHDRGPLRSLVRARVLPRAEGQVRRAEAGTGDQRHGVDPLHPPEGSAGPGARGRRRRGRT